jgi:hypothetical protein
VTLVARPIPVGSAVADTSAKLSLSEARALWAAGERTIIRYVFFGPARPGDIDAAEIAMLTGLGFTVLLVQHVRNPGWVGSTETGEADAGWAMKNAAAAGYAPSLGLYLGLDLEGVGRGGPAHAAAWCARLVGYAALVYVGYASGMTTATLDALEGDPIWADYPVRFWADYAALSQRPTPSKGWTLHQQAQTTVAGIGIDRDTVMQGGLCGLADGDVNVEDPDPSEAPTRPSLIPPPVPFHSVSTVPPPPDDEPA